MSGPADSIWIRRLEWITRAKLLKQEFQKFGECEEPVSRLDPIKSTSLQTLAAITLFENNVGVDELPNAIKTFVVNAWKSKYEPALAEGLACPDPLLALLSAAGSWHISKHHCGVFGFNMFDKGNFLNKVEIIGDEEMVEDWKTDHPTPNCAESGWECFAAVSEYDYIFVCLEKGSEHFGKTRLMVNNCWEDTPLLASFEDFFEKIEGFADKRNKQHEDEQENGDEEDIELLEFLDFIKSD